MTGLYIFTLAAGLPLLLWFAFSGGDADGLDVDVDSDGIFSLVSLSTVAFVLTFFGATGVVGGGWGSPRSWPSSWPPSSVWLPDS